MVIGACDVEAGDTCAHIDLDGRHEAGLYRHLGHCRGIARLEAAFDAIGAGTQSQDLARLFGDRDQGAAVDARDLVDAGEGAGGRQADLLQLGQDAQAADIEHQGYAEALTFEQRQFALDLHRAIACFHNVIAGLGRKLGDIGVACEQGFAAESPYPPRNRPVDDAAILAQSRIEAQGFAAGLSQFDTDLRCDVGTAALDNRRAVDGGGRGGGRSR